MQTKINSLTLPQYEAAVTVGALAISDFTVNPNTSIDLTFDHPHFSVLTIPQNDPALPRFAGITEQDKGYLITAENGFIDWVPQAVFQSSYTKVEDYDPLPDGLTISDLAAMAVDLERAVAERVTPSDIPPPWASMPAEDQAESIAEMATVLQARRDASNTILALHQRVGQALRDGGKIGGPAVTQDEHPLAFEDYNLVPQPYKLRLAAFANVVNLTD